MGMWRHRHQGATSRTAGAVQLPVPPSTGFNEIAAFTRVSWWRRAAPTLPPSGQPHIPAVLVSALGPTVALLFPSRDRRSDPRLRGVVHRTAATKGKSTVRAT